MPGNELGHVRCFSGYGAWANDVTPVNDLRVANVTSSKVAGKPGMHRPLLDIDLPAKLIPSSTSGHFHLYLDREMPWDDYAFLLCALAEVQVIQPGYRDAALTRKATYLRLPWIKKG